MSRLTKTFEIEGYDKTFMVRELKIEEILSLMNTDLLNDVTLETLEKLFDETFLPLCSNVTFEEIKKMTPTEAKKIWDEFSEVNASFFVLVKKAGMEKVLNQMMDAIIVDFGKLAVASSSQVMLES